MKKIATKAKRRFLVFTIALVGLGFTAKMSDNYFEISKNIEIFSDLYKNVNLYYSDDTSPGKLMKTGMDAMLRSLDPYTIYIPESKIEDFRIQNTGQYGGIGASVRKIDGEIVISDPYEGFPAQKAGIQTGDILMTIDNKPVKGVDSNVISDLLKGQAGTTVKVGVKRYGELKEFDIERADVQIPNVPYSGMMEDNVGYVKLNKFTRSASNDIKSAYVEMKKEGMEKMVIDLRGNTGGLLNEAIKIVNLFVHKGTPIVSTKGRLESWNKTYNANYEAMDADIPLIILVDEMSASASEVVSGAIQDLDRGVIIGTETFGKGLVQETKDIAYNAKIKITVAKYYTPSGRCIQKLDYFNKNDGKVEEVPDSLISAFKTSNGREVFDGRGILPDVLVDDEPVSKILIGLFDENHLFNYATDYVKDHPTLMSEESYVLSDADYDAFKSYVLAKGVDYSTDAETVLDDLIEVAKMEKAYDGNASEFEKLKAELKPNLARDLDLFQDQIRDVLENEIVSRYYYQKGRMKNMLEDDPYMKLAYEYFDTGKYNQILDPQ